MTAALVAAVIIITSPQGVRELNGQVPRSDCGKHLSGDIPGLGGAVSVRVTCPK